MARIPVNSNIIGLGAYLVLYLDSTGTFYFGNSVALESPVPVYAEVSGVGMGLTIQVDAAGTYTASLDPTPLNDVLLGSAFGDPEYILINYTTGNVTAGAFTDTLSAILARSSGGGGGYAAKAVQFWDGVTNDLPCWVGFADPMTGIGSFSQVTACGWFFELALSLNNTAVITGPLNGGPLYFGNQLNSATDFGFLCQNILTGDSFLMDSDNGVFTAGAWHFFYIAYDTNHPAGEKIGHVYVDGVNVANPALTVDASNAFAFDWGIDSHPSLLIPDRNSFFVGDDQPILVADVQIWLGQCIDPSNPSNLEKFIVGGKPVDPAIAAAEFGQQTFLFSGDATSFATNQGTWQDTPVTVTGYMTNATTSPSD